MAWNEEWYQQSVALLWRPEVRGRRGPRRALPLSAVVAEAVAIADHDGLAGLSMQRLAGALGVGTMSLYAYVRTKDDLVALMVDAVYGTPPTLARLHWRAAMREWANALRATYTAHPWVVPLLPRSRVMGPREAAWVEEALGALASLEMSGSEEIGLLLSLSGLVQAAVGADVRTGEVDGVGRDVPGSALLNAASLRAHDTEGKLLRLRHLLERVWPDTSPQVEKHPGDPFRFGVELLLDGVAALERRPEREFGVD